MSVLINPYHFYSDLFIWLDGADPYANENASTPADGGTVGTWYDKSLNLHNLSAFSTATAPTYDATNKKLVFTDGQNIFSNFIDNFPKDEFTIMMVASVTADGTTGTDTYILQGLDFETGLDQNWHFVGESGSESRVEFKYPVSGTDFLSVIETNINATAGIFEFLGGNTSTTQSVDLNNTNATTTATAKINMGTPTLTNLVLDNVVGTIVEGQSVTGTGLTAQSGSAFIVSNIDSQGSGSAQIDLTKGDSDTFNPSDNADLSFNIANTKTPTFFTKTGLKLFGSTAGDIHELLIFKKKLAKHERLGLQGYLKHKYGLADSTLQAGVDSASVAYTFHPFISNAPLVNEPVTTTISSNTKTNLPDLFQGLHKTNPRTPFTFIRLSLDENTNNSDTNHGDGVEARGGIKQYYFTQEVGDDLSAFVPISFPCLMSVSPAPVEIVPTQGVSLRANVTIKLRDFIRADDTVSFFSKFLAQNEFYLGRRIEIFEGFMDDNYDLASGSPNILQFFDGRREYKIDSMHLDNNVLTIKAKDPLTLGDKFKSKVPKPSRFSLDADLSSDSSTPTINVKYDDITQTGGNITTSSFADFETTFGANGTTGFIRINEEIMGYTSVKTGSIGSSPVVQINITSRGQWGTDSSNEHSAEDSVQQCVVFGSYTDATQGKFIDEVAYELLVNQANVPASAIETVSGRAYSWTDERQNWLNAFKINTVLSEPKEVNKTLGELASSVGTSFFYDDYIGKIIMKADTPVIEQSNFVTITDDDILYNTFRLFNSDKQRVSRVFYYYGIKNHTEDRDKPKNFRNLYVVIDDETEGSSQYGVESNKVIFAWGVSTTPVATAVAQRIVNRFAKTPVTCTFDLDVSNDRIDVGDHFFLQTKHNLLPDGTQPVIEMQCLSVTYDSKRQINKIKAQSFSFLGDALARVTENIDSLNAAGSGYPEGSTIFTGVSSSSAGNVQPMTVKIDNVTASGNVTDYTVQDYGKGHASGDIITFTGSGGTGFSILIGVGFFEQEGTGDGTTASPYTGNRLTKGFISCDSAISTLNGGDESVQFISAEIITAGSGYTNGIHAFTGNEIVGATRGSGLTLSVTVSGNAVTAVSVTSNPTSGTEKSEATHKGYTDGVVLNLVGHGGSNAQIRLTPEAKMSTGGEPYTIV